MTSRTAAREASNGTSAPELTTRVDGAMARVAIAALLLGIFWIWVVNWLAAGWAALILSPLFLWLAHQFAIAPCCEETAGPAEEPGG